MGEKLIGKISHYFNKVNVAAIEIAEGEVSVGDTIRIVGHTTDFTQTIDSMQIDRAPVERAVAGQAIGIRVDDAARVGDKVMLVTPDD
ncbi:EF-Tu/IF-2/RF-3 family GTPase [Acidobacteriota bacterium]